MRIMLDTKCSHICNTFSKRKLNQLIVKVAEDYTLVLSTYVVDELKSVV